MSCFELSQMQILVAASFFALVCQLHDEQPLEVYTETAQGFELPASRQMTWHYTGAVQAENR